MKTNGTKEKEDPDMNLPRYVQLIFDKGMKIM
jgi:hypothetical protein